VIGAAKTGIRTGGVSIAPSSSLPRAGSRILLGPFLSKSFATTLSPWIVTAEALSPHRMAWQRSADGPQHGESRTFLEDGDAVIIRGWCERDGFARIGFGEVRGTLLPA
jgi:hypothetical protein